MDVDDQLCMDLNALKSALPVTAELLYSSELEEMLANSAE